jgi:RimJ/RimL family protein N-acetyltransferase
MTCAAPPDPPAPAGSPAGSVTPRLAIEPLAPHHAAGLHAALDHPEVWRYVDHPELSTVAAMQARIERLALGPGPTRPDERWWNFAVWLRSEARIIGQLQASSYGDWAEIAYLFGPRWWRQGFATESTRWLIDHLARHGIAELWAAVHPDNAASQRVLRRTGFIAIDPPARPLSSFDPGDAAFVRRI